MPCAASSEASPPCARHPSPTATAFRLRGSLEQIRDDLHRFAGCGVDEVFLDLNFDSELVGGPDADPARAMHPATAVLRWASRLKRANRAACGLALSVLSTGSPGGFDRCALTTILSRTMCRRSRSCARSSSAASLMLSIVFALAVSPSRLSAASGLSVSARSSSYQASICG
jgi:hypothetical protein